MKTPEEIVESIPKEMRGHVFHLLGKALHHKTGDVTANDTTGDDSGGNGPPPPHP
jgi:hypothetical protein